MDEWTDDKPYYFILLIKGIESTPGLNQIKQEGKMDIVINVVGGGEGRKGSGENILYLVPLNNKL